MDATATMCRLYNVFDLLRKMRPDTYREDFAAVLDMLSDFGAEDANRLVRELTGAVA